MRTARVAVILLLVAGTVILGPARARAQTARTAPENKLVGTWKLTSARYGGQSYDVTQMGVTLKHITPEGFMWVSYDPGTKQITRAEGGTYTFKGERYEETPRYGFGAAFDTTGKHTQTFTAKVDADRWRTSGTLSTGLRIEETWERVRADRAERRSIVPR